MTKLTGDIHQDQRGLFVTGTDTQVGKTTVTAALGLALQQSGADIGVMKPVETGLATQTVGAMADGTLLQQLLCPEVSLDLISPYRFDQPLAPLEAARQTGTSIEFERVADSYSVLSARHEFMLVEGVGGILVPLTEDRDVRDLVKFLGLPCLLISRAELGSVNHTRLTLEALRDRGIPVLAIVLNETTPPSASTDRSRQQQSTFTLIRDLCPFPLFGPIPYRKHIEQDRDTEIRHLSHTPVIKALAAAVYPERIGTPE